MKQAIFLSFILTNYPHNSIFTFIHENFTMTMKKQDIRQRFFIENSPVRGDIVRLADSYQTVINQKNYPVALQKLLGEMLVSASLLISTLKIDGRLSIQLQNNQNSDEMSLNWAMAECDNHGQLRGLADWRGDWHDLTTAKEAFSLLKKNGEGVLFINIQPNNNSEGYQGIVELVADNLTDCLTHYQQQSMQIPTLINLASDEQQAGGVLLQLLPHTEEEKEQIDNDLFPRLSILTNTLKSEELTQLPADEILYRLYHEEDVITAEPVALAFGCTCSEEKSLSAIFQLGENQALEFLNEQGGKIGLDCGFCGTVYEFNEEKIKNIFS